LANPRVFDLWPLVILRAGYSGVNRAAFVRNDDSVSALMTAGNNGTHSSPALVSRAKSKSRSSAPSLSKRAVTSATNGWPCFLGPSLVLVGMMEFLSAAYRTGAWEENYRKTEPPLFDETQEIKKARWERALIAAIDG
jgi:hypothetical protein